MSQAVKRAEEKTSGEIVVALAAESSDYSFWELFAALLASLLAAICTLPLADKIRAFDEAINWTSSAWTLPAIYVFAAFFFVIPFFLLINAILPLDRLVIPKAIKEKAVNERAVRAFLECGVSSTRERTGILIFVSYLEKQARVLADEGIAKKIGPDLWRLIVSELSEEIGKKNTEAAFCEAVQKCGDLLAQRFPADRTDNPDELDNGVVILER
ncbi:MAG: TPM domain-containing protein [Treponema sp.]|nr:TPM domain-containing protein [Treponema sp.]